MVTIADTERPAGYAASGFGVAWQMADARRRPQTPQHAKTPN